MGRPLSSLPDPVLTLDEAAKRLRVDRRTVISMIENRKLPAGRVGKKNIYRIRAVHVERLLDGRAI